MTRFVLVALAVSTIPGVVRGDDKSTSVRITGTVVLPKGAKLPNDATVAVRVYFYQPSGANVTYYKQIGSTSFRPTDPSKPLAFSVAVHKSYPDKYDPGAFLMYATVYTTEGNRAVKVFASTDDDAVVPFTGAGKPKTDVKLRVSKDKD